MNNLNDKLAALKVLRSNLTDKEYKYMYASILIDYYAGLLELNSINKGRRYVLNTVNQHLVRQGFDAVSYQVVMDSKWK